MTSPTWVRPLGTVLALALLFASPAPPAEAASEGQMTWAVHVSIAPTWFDPGEHPGIVTSMMIFYALHDALVKPMPGRTCASTAARACRWVASTTTALPAHTMAGFTMPQVVVFTSQPIQTR